MDDHFLTQLKETIKTEVLSLGFTHIGFTEPKTPESSPIFLKWLEKGYAADMSYLFRPDTIEKRLDPKIVMPNVKTIIALAMPYSPPEIKNSNPYIGKIASYATGDDYHLVIPELLENMMQSIASKISEQKLDYKIYTDTGPILERDIAQSSGIGWIGKNSCLIIPGHGSYFFLAEIFINIQFPFDKPEPHDYCGSCTRCLDNCPTNCINDNRTIDAGRCISYLTIENKKDIPIDIRDSMGQWVFGCDICQSVCPWNIQFSKKPEHKYFSPNPTLLDYDLLNPENFSLMNFKETYKKSPILRSKRKGFLRNLIVAIGNTKSTRAIPILLNIFTSENEPMIRNLTIWALKQFPVNDVNNLLNDFIENNKNHTSFDDLKMSFSDFQGTKTGE